MLNIFVFDAALYIQKIGTAMGTRAAPTFANLFMGKIDTLIKNCAASLVFFYKRFIDDILIIWTGSEAEFLDFMTKINKLHPTIKFTCEYDFATKSTNFLDTKISIVNGKIVTDLFRKPTDRVQYLLPRSCHPGHIFTNIPYSLALRLVRICSERETLLTRCEELKQMLLSRNYNRNIIDSAIDRALKQDRLEVLKKVIKPKNDRVIFAVTYHPALPSISKMLKTHWTSLVRNKEMLKYFPTPPMVAYRQPKNLKNTLIRTKLPQLKRNQRHLVGNKKCNKPPCKMCPYVLETKNIKSKTNQSFETPKPQNP